MIAAIDAILRETMLFAAIGFLIGGIDDLIIDLAFAVHRVQRWAMPQGDAQLRFLSALPTSATKARIAIFVPAWDEAPVIGAMLASLVERIDYPDYCVYVGTYPNDPATIAAVAAMAERDGRIRLVIGTANGPTTKAGCLNSLWAALARDEAAHGGYANAIVLHDAEDLVHPAELRLFAHFIGRYDTVQLPVLPLVDRHSRLVGGHYCDEFAEAHAKQLVVRQFLGAGLPLAGVGCAIARTALEAIAKSRGGAPFDAASLTEDYELGLTIAAMGGRGMMARVRERPGGPLVAVRAFFPATLEAAVRQKSRWMIGIALAGWDRVGWARSGEWREHWMRMRDRRAPLAVLVLAAAYVALVSWGLACLLRWITGEPGTTPLVPAWLLGINAALLFWRLAMRILFTGVAYGAWESLWSVPRLFISNLVSLLAARRAMMRYVAMLSGKTAVWDKTAHRFPTSPASTR
ncbi:MAG: glycosyl transferase family protein [Sphingomonas sp.]